MKKERQKQDSQQNKDVVQVRNRAVPDLQAREALTPYVDPMIIQRAVASLDRVAPVDILALQRTAGNRAVSGLIQAKLTVGPVGDRYEREADRVAEQVMSMPNPQAVSSQRSAVSGQPSLQRQAPEEEEEVQAKPLAASITPLVQRQAEEEEKEVQTKPLVQRQAEEEEEKVQTKPLVQRQAEEEEEEEIQTKSLVQRQADGSFEAGSELESRLVAHKGDGRPLPGDIRAFMEPRFGADFGGVRVHTGSEAAELNRRIQAKAFTHGSDIHFNAGQYDPASDAGKRLLAHELTHVVQQNAGRVRGHGGELRVQRARLIEHAELMTRVPKRDLTGVVPLLPRLRALDQRERRIRNRVLQYNRIADDVTKYQQRLRILNELDRNIHEWFGYLESRDFEREPLVPHMQALLDQSDAEHVAIIAAIKNTSEMPLDVTGMEPATTTAIQTLWQSIVNQTGYLKIESGGDVRFLNQVLSDIAKILQGPGGQALIQYLNAAPVNPAVAPQGIEQARLPAGSTGYETIISPTTAALSRRGFAPAGGAAPDNEESANKPISQVLYEGQTRGETTYEKLSTPPSPAEQSNYPLVTDSASLNAALLQRKRGFRIVDGTDTVWYKFSAGQGSSTVMSYGQAARSIGPAGEEIITPKFVMLAHELGHALRVRGGAAGQEGLFAQFHETAKTWSNNAEEMLNAQTENVVRQEHGIAQKGTYKTWKHLYGASLIPEIVSAFSPVMQRINQAGFQERDVIQFGEARPAFKELVMIGPMFASGFTEPQQAERKRIKDAIGSAMHGRAMNAVPRLYDEFMASKVPLLLPGYLQTISNSPVKATSLEGGLTHQEKIKAVAYLHGHQDEFEQIKDLLHLGYFDRRGTTLAQREQVRIQTLSYLVDGRTIEEARTKKQELLRAL
jgi:hypothetical protein